MSNVATGPCTSDLRHSVPGDEQQQAWFCCDPTNSYGSVELYLRSTLSVSTKLVPAVRIVP